MRRQYEHCRRQLRGHYWRGFAAIDTLSRALLPLVKGGGGLAFEGGREVSPSGGDGEMWGGRKKEVGYVPYLLLKSLTDQGNVAVSALRLSGIDISVG